MINKVKDYLGIEGVRIAIPAEGLRVRRDRGLLSGTLELSSLRPQVVTSITLSLRERYQRGRGDDQLIDTYELGALSQDRLTPIAADELLELPFELSFAERLSPLDGVVRKSRLLKPLGAIVRKANNTSSSYTLVASCRVEGVSLHPTVRVSLELD